LRDFSNLAFHNILDWRLGLDLARLALDPAAPIDLAVPYWHPLAAAISQAYFASKPGWSTLNLAGLPAGRRNDAAEIICHPLWNRDPSSLHPVLTQAQTEATAAGVRTIELRSLFEVIRRPHA
jgi:hypothetical protein